MAQGRGIPSESTTRFSRLLCMCMWRSWKQKQIAQTGLEVPSTWPHLTIYRSLHESLHHTLLSWSTLMMEHNCNDYCITKSHHTLRHCHNKSDLNSFVHWLLNIVSRKAEKSYLITNVKSCIEDLNCSKTYLTILAHLYSHSCWPWSHFSPRKGQTG